VVGAPRSGTTFLAALLNAHPHITLTVEGRLLALIKQVIEVDCQRDDLVDVAHQERFIAFLKQEAAGLIERYYRDALGVATPIWGDKHPPYGDPALLSGRTGAALQRPISGSALRLIDELLPESKFIHIVRESDQVAQSLLSRGWVNSFEDGLAVRNQYVDEIAGFFDKIDSRRRLTLAYATLLERPDEAADGLARFLGISSAPFMTFLDAERRAPTPFSEPMRDLGAVYRGL
jgi:hypothetical protein